MSFLAKSVLVMLLTSATIVAGAHVADQAAKVTEKLNHRAELNCKQINEVIPGGCTLRDNSN